MAGLQDALADVAFKLESLKVGWAGAGRGRLALTGYGWAQANRSNLNAPSPDRAPPEPCRPP